MDKTAVTSVIEKSMARNMRVEKIGCQCSSKRVQDRKVAKTFCQSSCIAQRKVNVHEEVTDALGWHAPWLLVVLDAWIYLGIT